MTSCVFSTRPALFASTLVVAYSFLISLLAPFRVHAIEHVFNYTPQGTSCSPSEDYLKANWIEARFNTVTKRFRWSVNFAPPPVATLPSLYYLVVNDGPMPRGQAGTLAIFYFDATVPADPKLTVYGYSGENNGQSYRDGSQEPGPQPADKILSSLVSQSWITELSVTDLPNGTRTLTFDIDATAIINHEPLYPDPGAEWFGTGFAQSVGLWFHLFRDVGVAYGDDGFLSSFYGSEDCYDLENLETVIDQPPVCNTGAAFYQNACEGLLTTIPLDGSLSFDPEQQPLEYSWSTTCQNSTLAPADAAQTVLTLSNPGLGLAQECSVTLTVSDGPNQVSCPAEIQTPACELDCLGQPNGSAALDQCGVCNGTNSCIDCAGTPFGALVLDRCLVCGGDGSSCLGCSEVNNASVQLQMDSTTAALRALVYRATRRLLMVSRTQGNTKYSRRVRREADASYLNGWTLTYQTPSISLTCENQEFCAQSSVIETIGEFNKASSVLRDLVEGVVDRMSRQRGRVTPGDRHTKRVAKRLHQTNLAASASLPTSISVCSP